MTSDFPFGNSSTPRYTAAARPARDLILAAQERERAGCIPEAVEQYEAAIAESERTNDHTVLAEALRRLAVVRHQRQEFDRARELCLRSHHVATTIGNEILTAEALNTLGVMLLREGKLAEAQQTFLGVLQLGGASPSVRARVEQNLGIIANIHGDLDEAMSRYASSLADYQLVGDEHGCALAYHNLGMVSADKKLLDDAETYFQQSLSIAERAGDVRLQGLCLLNHAEVHVARQRFEEGRKNAEAALAIFDQLGARDHKASAYRVIGVVYRETGRPALAESRLRSSIELSVTASSVTNEAEATMELAVVYQSMGRNQEALALLNSAHRLFRRLDARIDLVNVGGRMAELEGTYRAVVRQWGQSIESSDSYTFGHSTRVAESAVDIAKAMGLDEQEQNTIRLGGYLHDLGKVKVPHEVLNKPGPLTRSEVEVVQMHPVWGLELLANVEFPWDIKPIIRWHHEKYDGSGYPDRLRGEEIPLIAQLVGIADVFDALTTSRAYRPALSEPDAIVEMVKCRVWWSDRVFEAFMKARLTPDRSGVVPARQS